MQAFHTRNNSTVRCKWCPPAWKSGGHCIGYTMLASYLRWYCSLSWGTHDIAGGWGGRAMARTPALRWLSSQGVALSPCVIWTHPLWFPLPVAPPWQTGVGHIPSQPSCRWLSNPLAWRRAGRVSVPWRGCGHTPPGWGAVHSRNGFPHPGHTSLWERSREHATPGICWISAAAQSWSGPERPWHTEEGLGGQHMWGSGPPRTPLDRDNNVLCHLGWHLSWA